MKKATRILTTILILSCFSTLYCLLAAPFLEPESKFQKVELLPPGANLPTRQIMTLFNPDDWEVKARHLEINNIHLFIGNNSSLLERSVNINKCTIVIVNSIKPLKAIVIQCLGNINLNFAQPPSFQERRPDNRLLNGAITGKIRVTSKGDEENLSFETEDFYIDKDRILTKANVYFKYGRTQGIGSGMQIQLINHGLFGSPEHNIDSGPLSHKIENITLQKLQRLIIFPPAKKQSAGQKNKSDLFSSPLELRCDGPFVFNALNKYASFEQNVSLIQTVSNKASNSIRCQHLFLYFTSANRNESNQQTGDSAQNSDSDVESDEWNLQLERLQADGAPVVIEAPEYQTKIQADRLVATLSPLSFELDSSRQCEIQYKTHLISAQNLTYFIGENGTPGTLICNCAGWISSQMNQNGKQVRARWSDSLRLEPDRKDPTESIVSVQGNARLELENNNNTEAAIAADGFFFWLTKKSTTANAPGEMTLSRMQANNNVIMKSNPITAKVNTLQLWFEELGKTGDSGEEASKQSTGTNFGNRLSTQIASGASPSNSELSPSYNVTGELFQGKILLGQNDFEISELTLKNKIRIVQNSSSPNGDNKGLEMSGSQIQIFNLTHPSATASLIGQPAAIQYNNMTLTGSAINVNKGSNRIWIDSGGKALFLGSKQETADSSESSSANSSSNPYSAAMAEPAKIEWSKSMVFQNDTLTFNGDVSLQRKDQFAQCDALSIMLNKKIDFQNLDSTDLQKSLDVRYIVLNNSVKLENITSENGVTVAMDCLTTSKITIDMKKQSFVAEGPGRAMTQRKMKGSDDEAGDSQSASSSEQAAADANAAQNPLSQLTARNSQLVNLSVDFQKRLEGSYAPHSLSTFTFSGYVEAVYSPIDEIGKPIKTFNLSELPPQAFTLKCSQMQIQTELGAIASEETSKQPAGANNESRTALWTGNGASPSRNSSFIASGGVTVEGRVYNASADKITFEAKNSTMTLEGDGQIPAQFFYQKVLGGRYNQASSSTIYYNTQTGAVKGEGIQEFSLFLSPKNSQ